MSFQFPPMVSPAPSRAVVSVVVAPLADGVSQGPWLPGTTDMPAYRLAVCGNAHGVVLTQGDLQQLHIKSSQVYLSRRLYRSHVVWCSLQLLQAGLPGLFYCPSLSSFTGIMQTQKLRVSNVAAVLVWLDI